MNATTATGDTPLSFACENGHTDVADVLLSAGAELVRHILPCLFCREIKAAWSVLVIEYE